MSTNGETKATDGDRVRIASAVRSAREQLADLLGQPAERVAAVQRTDEGWTMTVDVVEVERIPPTTDVLASYEVVLDAGGDLVGYERVRRFTRGAGQDDR